ncbi:hypothetical protein PVK06_002090 [Gossypium arboreum]|uniref:Uncharacterized protein n=1 Tax=Gossypium arboreum TaxID=29729 RepID=A0ABR0R3V2_GOSAR|nr:hypothetical protein PVK06_002090 [Gossypium arboreum]
MPEFPNFPKAFLPLSKGGWVEKEPVEVQSDKAKSANPEKEKAAEKEPEKTESMHIEGKEDDQNKTNSTATANKRGKDMSIQGREINRIIDEITKSRKEEEELPIQSLKRKMRYNSVVRRSTHRFKKEGLQRMEVCRGTMRSYHGNIGEGNDNHPVKNENTQ